MSLLRTEVFLSKSATVFLILTAVLLPISVSVPRLLRLQNVIIELYTTYKKPSTKYINIGLPPAFSYSLRE